MRNQIKQTGAAFRQVLTVIFILLMAVLQTTVLRGLEVFHVIPNLLFITVVCYSLRRGDYSAMVVGVACGLILDVTGGRAVGINTLLCTYAAFFCVRVSSSLFNNNVFVSMVFVLLLSIPYELLIYLFYFVIWGRGALGYALLCKILPAVVYNFLFTIVLYPAVRRVAG